MPADLRVRAGGRTSGRCPGAVCDPDASCSVRVRRSVASLSPELLDMRKSMVNRRFAGVGGVEPSAMGWGRILPVVLVLVASSAAAQTPWPTQQQPQQQQAPWPAQQSQPQGQTAWPAQQPQQLHAAPAWPQHQAAAPTGPMTATAGPAMAPPGGGMMSPMGTAGGGKPPPCSAVLNKLHSE